MLARAFVKVAKLRGVVVTIPADEARRTGQSSCEGIGAAKGGQGRARLRGCNARALGLIRLERDVPQGMFLHVGEQRIDRRKIAMDVADDG